MKFTINTTFFLSVVWFSSLFCKASVFEKDTTYTTYQTWQKLRKKHPDIKIVYSMQDKNLISAEDLGDCGTISPLSKTEPCNTF